MKHWPIYLGVLCLFYTAGTIWNDCRWAGVLMLIVGSIDSFALLCIVFTDVRLEQQQKQKQK